MCSCGHIGGKEPGRAVARSKREMATLAVAISLSGNQAAITAESASSCVIVVATLAVAMSLSITLSTPAIKQQ